MVESFVEEQKRYIDRHGIEAYRLSFNHHVPAQASAGGRWLKFTGSYILM
jgi:hypothetical protein